jgi:hypothetical protein
LATGGVVSTGGIATGGLTSGYATGGLTSGYASGYNTGVTSGYATAGIPTSPVGYAENVAINNALPVAAKRGFRLPFFGARKVSPLRSSLV